MDLSIILPTYCEAGNIARLITAIEANLAPLQKMVEILVVDDNSPDGTAAAVQTLAPLPGFTIRCLVRTHERGLASAILHGIMNACGEQLIVMDTDFNHSPDNLPEMLHELQSCDLVIGSRFVKGGGMEDHGRYLGSLLFNLFIRTLLLSPVHDNLCGFFAVRRSDLLKMDLDRLFTGYGEYFIRLIHSARKMGLAIHEVPVFYTLRTSGESKSKFLTMIVDYTRTTLKLLFNK